MKLYANTKQAQWALANKINRERKGRAWMIAQTENGWYFIKRRTYHPNLDGPAEPIGLAMKP